MTPAPALLECRDLVKHYGSRTAVGGVSFHIDEGETYGLLGPNGAGKTTTISMVCGLLARDGGEVTIGGAPMHERAVEVKRAVGYVPQELALYPDLTGRENLAFFGRLYRLTGAARRARIEQVLEQVGLTDRADERVDRYSGGMKRRLNIAAGLLHEPRLLVLDEPTVGVDPQSRNAILESVEELGGEGLAVLYTTHYMEEAERLCDRIGIIDEGHLLAEGTRAQLTSLVAGGARVRVTGAGDLAALAVALDGEAGVREPTADGGEMTFLCDTPGAILPRVLEHAAAVDFSVGAFEVEETDLEAVFLHLTGKALRD